MKPPQSAVAFLCPRSSVIDYFDQEEIGRRSDRDQGRIYARDYKGSGPAFVLMHDNLHIYDELIPYPVAGGRRVVAFDFLGFAGHDVRKRMACCPCDRLLILLALNLKR
jgi:peptidoglycan/xylan/chitin deacetylase (PgdA/CDA1 family)